jgi:hypothetical protein
MAQSILIDKPNFEPSKNYGVGPELVKTIFADPIKLSLA